MKYLPHLVVAAVLLISNAAMAQQNAPLQGNVRGSAVPFEQGLVFITQAAEQTKQLSDMIIAEGTRKYTEVLRGPNALPGGVIIPPVGSPSGVINFGDMPMRRSKLDRWVADMDATMVALRQHADAIIVPPERAQTAAPAHEALQAAVRTAQDQLAMLKELAASKRLVNNAIAKQALRIQDSMSDVLSKKRLLEQVVNGTSNSSSSSEFTKSEGSSTVSRRASTYQSFKTLTTSDTSETSTAENGTR